MLAYAKMKKSRTQGGHACMSRDHANIQDLMGIVSKRGATD